MLLNNRVFKDLASVDATPTFFCHERASDHILPFYFSLNPVLAILAARRCNN